MKEKKGTSGAVLVPVAYRATPPDHLDVLALVVEHNVLKFEAAVGDASVVQHLHRLHQLLHPVGDAVQRGGGRRWLLLLVLLCLMMTAAVAAAVAAARRCHALLQALRAPVVERAAGPRLHEDVQRLGAGEVDVVEADEEVALVCVTLRGGHVVVAAV